MRLFSKRCARIVTTAPLVLLTTGALAQGPRRELPSPKAVFSQLILARLQAFGRGDSAAYRALVGADLVHTDDHGTRRTFRQMLAHVAANRPPGGTDPAVRYNVSNVAVQVRGQADLAFVEATVSEGLLFGTQRMGGLWQETNVFAKRKERWYLVRHAETPIAGRAAHGIAGDSAQLKDFVGRYTWWPSYEDRITQRGATLYGQDTEKSAPWPFVQLSPDVFFPKNDSSTIVIFGRDATGRVTHYNVWAPGWPVIRAKKMR